MRTWKKTDTKRKTTEGEVTTNLGYRGGRDLKIYVSFKFW